MSDASERLRQWMIRSDVPQSLQRDNQATEDVLAVLDELDRYRELLTRAIRGLKHVGELHYPDTSGFDPHPLDCSLAGRVSHVFGTGMTRATELCREFGQDPSFDEAAERERMDGDA